MNIANNEIKKKAQKQQLIETAIQSFDSKNPHTVLSAIGAFVKLAIEELGAIQCKNHTLLFETVRRLSQFIERRDAPEPELHAALRLTAALGRAVGTRFANTQRSEHPLSLLHVLIHALLANKTSPFIRLGNAQLVCFAH